MPEEKYAVYIIEINDWLNKLQFRSEVFPDVGDVSCVNPCNRAVVNHWRQVMNKVNIIHNIFLSL